MSCRRELTKILRAAPAPPRADAETMQDPLYRAGYAHGFRVALEEALEVVDEHEEEEE